MSIDPVYVIKHLQFARKKFQRVSQSSNPTPSCATELLISQVYCTVIKYSNSNLNYAREIVIINF